MSFKPMKPEDFNADNIEFTKIKKLDNGANVMYLNYNGKPIHLTTPELDLPFDCKYWSDDGDASGKWAVRCNLSSGKGVPELIDALKKMDEKIKGEAVKNSVAWFKKRNMSVEAVEALYNHQIKEDLDPETGEVTGRYPPSFNFKVIKRDGKINCKVYGPTKNELNVNDPDGGNSVQMDDLLKRGSKVKVLIRCNGIWIANGKFGCTWRAEQIKVTPAQNFDDCVFEDSDNEDDAVIEKIDGNFVDTSSEEEGEAEAEAEAEVGEGSDSEVVDEPKKKARKVRKKE